ncbi:site-specific tyrosine recombinase XerC [Planctomycetes bacterium Pan216]|uniref:Site-specific tyrosine recombinase XerC n=1 Tax=Kolteria novifilia TaxID=2527975 RepID=A0A518B0D9_9BACT|nr:site-specific tyrosine recombinase XerC [Planctomycetes bacterium Pan216]
MSRAWIHQDARQVRIRGPENASYYVGWYDPEGKQRCKSFGTGSRGKQNAEKYQRRVEGELAAGTYQSARKATWKDFRAEYETNALAGLSYGTQGLVKQSLDVFEKHIKPKKISAITTRTIVSFVAKRRLDRGKAEGSKVSKATINKDLRHLRAALRKAKKWGYLATVPDFDMEREPELIKPYVTPEHFCKLFDGCDAATFPRDVPNVLPGDWWRALLLTAYLTGWRIGELLALEWTDVDLEEGAAITRADENKGKRDDRVPLHEVVCEHLAKIKAFHPRVFPWDHDLTHLYAQFRRLQESAKVTPEDWMRKQWYTFHDLRRAFATMNYDRMTGDELQKLMRHQSYATTQRYIKLGGKLRSKAADIFVPDIKGTRKQA